MSLHDFRVLAADAYSYGWTYPWGPALLIFVCWVGGFALLAWYAAKFGQHVIDRYWPARPLLTRAALGVDIGRDGAPIDPPTEPLAVQPWPVDDQEAARRYSRLRVQVVQAAIRRAPDPIEAAWAGWLAGCCWNDAHPHMRALIDRFNRHPSLQDSPEVGQ